MNAGGMENPGHDRRLAALAALLIAACLCAAYSNAWVGPFVFDDIPSIVDNPTIRDWRHVLEPPSDGSTVSGRPLLNLSFAVNRALSGAGVRGFHVANLVIHILAALALFGLARRMLLTPVLRGRFGANAVGLALAIALIWGLHPIQTESVTYVSQRAESLMGLFYLLTLYGFVRGVESGRGGVWLAFSVAACAAGMATKEVMASAPVVVLLFDGIFVSAGFRDALRRRRAFYCGLAGTWLILCLLVYGASDRGGTAGFGAPVQWSSYAVVQLKAVAHYLRLAVWPDPLVFYYGRSIRLNGLELAADATIIALLAIATAIGVWRRRPLGFAGAWFFLVLAPSSSVVPIATEVIAEHRMYLPLAAVVAVIALGAWLLAVWAAGTRGAHAAWLILAVVAASLGYETHRRNEAYGSELALWSDTAAKARENPYAHNNVGNALLSAGRVPEAIQQYRQAASLQPDFAEFHFNLGNALAKSDQTSEAISEFRAALKESPGLTEAREHLGIALARAGRMDEAIAQFRDAVRVEPGLAKAHLNLGTALYHCGRTTEALNEFETALRLNPDSPEAHVDLGLALAASDQMAEAVTQYREALQLDPGFTDAAFNLGNALAKTGHPAEAVPYYRRAIVLKGDSAETYNNLGLALAASGKFREAIDAFRKALSLKPESAGARLNLARVLAQSGRTAEAIAEYERVLAEDPRSGLAEYNLGALLAGSGRLQEAKLHLEKAVRLMPGFREARDNLDRINSMLEGNIH